MKNSYIKAQLTSLDTITVLVFSTTPRPYKTMFYLQCEGNEPIALSVKRSSGSNLINLFDLALPFPYDFSKSYSISVTGFAPQHVDTSDAVYFPEFDEMFSYYGNDLGSIYSKEETTFALWAPLSINVLLSLENDKGEFISYKMSREEKGVYRITIKGDLLNRKYRYIINNNGVISATNDPYGKGVSLNSEYSAVVDIEQIKNMGIVTPKTPFKEYVDAIIYEVNVRDFTEQNNGVTNIKNKGKYLGFVEEGRKTINGHPAGLDYLKYLGVTHVQLNPVIDFGSVYDENDHVYNWGYDPISMFSLEGSYSLHPEIPMERLIEFKTMINKLHEADIRVNLDVVYNHTYKDICSCYEKILPQYFFRRKNDGSYSNACGCGNDIASERIMVRKMIIDSLNYFVNVYDLDGFRFDLLGLIDVDTINTAYESLKKKKENIMLYGEGWNMGEMPIEKKACIENAYKLPHIAFFNDTFRDIVRGPVFDKPKKGYITGDISYKDGMKYAYFASSLDLIYKPRFINANQSLNYVECHDNNTLFDKIMDSNPNLSKETQLKICKLANAMTVVSYGIPFIHMGQEIGQSKKGLDNTYNLLNINMLDYRLIDERFEMVAFLKDLISFRKTHKSFSSFLKDDLTNNNEIFENDGALYFMSKNDNNDYPHLLFCFNPTDHIVTYDFGSDIEMIFADSGILNKPIIQQNAMFSPYSFSIITKKKEDN